LDVKNQKLIKRPICGGKNRRRITAMTLSYLAEASSICNLLSSLILRKEALGLGPIASKDAKHVFVYIARQLLAGRRIRDAKIRALVSIRRGRQAELHRDASFCDLPMHGHLASIRRFNFQVRNSSPEEEITYTVLL
jgi:hypothetical protein